MCTLIVLHRAHAMPLIVAANRDEFRGRSAQPPSVLHEQPRVVAGKDELGGGTWLGAAGTLFVGITNHWSAGHWGKGAGRRSRGKLVFDALCAGTVDGVRDVLEGIDGREYGPFNLMFGDPCAMYVAYGRTDRASVEQQPVDTGVHVLANDVLGSKYMPKADRARARVESMLALPLEELTAQLEQVLGDPESPAGSHSPPPGIPIDPASMKRLQAMCIEGGVYGTVSSSIVAIDHRGPQLHLHCEGSPQRDAFMDVTALHR